MDMRKAVIWAGMLLAVWMLAVPRFYTKAEEKPDEPLYTVVLGDSIAKGYAGKDIPELRCYGEIVTETLAADSGQEFVCRNYAKNGLATRGLNEKVLSKNTVRQDLKKADVIFLTMGSNDLLNTCKETAREILHTKTKFQSAQDALQEIERRVQENPLLIFQVIDALANWDYQEFDTQWRAAMETICEWKKDGAQIVVTNIYNPVTNLKLPGTMNQVVDEVIQNMNQIIEGYCSRYGYRIADLAQSDVTEMVQKDGLHPNQRGQERIAEIVREQIEGYERHAPKRPVDASVRKGDEGEEKENISFREWGIWIFLVILLAAGVGCRQKKRKKNRHK